MKIPIDYILAAIIVISSVAFFAIVELHHKKPTPARAQRAPQVDSRWPVLLPPTRSRPPGVLYCTSCLHAQKRQCLKKHRTVGSKSQACRFYEGRAL